MLLWVHVTRSHLVVLLLLLLHHHLVVIVVHHLLLVAPCHVAQILLVQLNCRPSPSNHWHLMRELALLVLVLHWRPPVHLLLVLLSQIGRIEHVGCRKLARLRPHWLVLLMLVAMLLLLLLMLLRAMICGRK